MIWVVIASGQSLKPEEIEYVRNIHASGNCKVAAVSNVGIDIAPWADILVSHDSSWWKNNPNAIDFEGIKYCRNHWKRCELFIPKPNNGCNSGYMAMQIAYDIYKAEKIILLGFDMHGTHYFGKHPEGLKNTTEDRFKVHIKQFDSWNGCEVVNCNMNSALEKFPKISIYDII